MARSRIPTFVAAGGILALSSCAILSGDRDKATLEVWNDCGETVTVAVGDGVDPRHDPAEFELLSIRLADGEDYRAGSFDGAGSFVVVAVGPDGAEVTKRVPKSLGAVLELRGDLCPS